MESNTRSELKTAILLVGGKSIRMRPYSENVPKCMVAVSGQPLLFWVLKWLKMNGIQNVILSVDYKKEVIFEYIKANSFGMEISFNDHSGCEETGDAIKSAIENQKVQDEVFLVMNGDELTDISLRNFLTFHNMHRPVATLLALPLRSPYGVMEINSDYIITAFKEKPLLVDKFMNGGIYLFTQAIREYLPDKGTIEKTTFVNLAKEGKIKAFKYFGFWATADSPKDIAVLEQQAEILKETRGL